MTVTPGGAEADRPTTSDSAFQQPAPTALKMAKLAAFRVAGVSGVTQRIRDSAWRTGRLLVLAYHGVSAFDEHEWNPALYLPPHALRARFEILKRDGYAVLPLKEAVDRLTAGTLPPRSVALTFDDGMHDFNSLVVPMLREFEFPATVYVTSYYAAKHVPVFKVATQYLLWMGRDRVIPTRGLIAGPDSRVDLSRPGVRFAFAMAMADHMRDAGEGVDDEAATLRQLSDLVGVDYDDFLRSRRLQIMTPDELRSLPPDLVDVQLHTHRHRVPLDRSQFLNELEENRRFLEPLRGNRVMDGFCYPSGITNDRFLPWLRELGIRVATTCRPGLATQQSDLLLLPRLVDSWLLTQLEFEGWLTGVAELFPRRPTLSGASD
jgi:peptidoglycan/xylan/chitin deacetylase (PgdA/CDA1 family)